MSTLNNWQDTNEAYLGAALHWLRLRLARQAEAQTATEPGLPPAIASHDEELLAAARAMAEAEVSEPPPALILLSRQFGLSCFEREVLLLLAAMELDTRIATLCARAQDDPSRPYPTFALAMMLFDDAVWDILSPERPLRYWRLLEIHQPPTQPLTTSPLRIDECILNYIKGLNYLDDRLAALFVPLGNLSTVALPPSQAAVAARLVHALAQTTPTEHLPVLHLLGADGQSKQLIAAHVATTFGLRLYRLPAALLPTQPGELETLARLWQRESILLPVGLLLDANAVEQIPVGAAAMAVQGFLARTDGVVFLDTYDSWQSFDRSALTVEVAKPSPVEQQAAWTDLTAPDAEVPGLLAGQFNLNLVAIHEVAEVVRVQSTSSGQLARQLWDTCLTRTRPRLDMLAQRLDARATWETLVLPAEETALLRQIADQVGRRNKVYDEWGFRRRMNRGLGICALFWGDSGTGKTMAGEVLANELRLNLYRIDLSAVVSKYIGETEKNLRQLFDAAEDGGALLFFDEADALFGKRSEVKDSHDRYANIEINYLLQRLEAYRGLAILATNVKGALDQAFMRRLRFVVNFPFPGLAERKRMWQTAFPPETPTYGLDYDRLARLTLTGGSVHNVALNAAFLAAGATPAAVTMPFVLSAVRTEFRKLERPMNEADFRWQEPVRLAV